QMRKFLLAGQSGVLPEIDHDDLALERANRLLQVVPLDDLEFHLGVFAGLAATPWTAVRQQQERETGHANPARLSHRFSPRFWSVWQSLKFRPTGLNASREPALSFYMLGAWAVSGKEQLTRRG